MRILIATTHRAPVGGVERYLQILIPALIGRGHEVALVYETPWDATAGAIDPPDGGLPAWCWAANREEALRKAAQWGPEVVYSQGLVDGDLEAKLLAAYPAAFYAHNYYGTCVSGRKCHSFPTLRPCDRTFGPVCLALYYPRRCGGLNPATLLSLYRRQSGTHTRLAQWQSILVASEHMYNEYLGHGVRPERLHLVHLPAADKSKPSAHAGRDGASGLRRILFLGRLTDIKGGEYLVRAVALAAGELKRALALTIAGDGPELAGVLDLGRTLGVDVRHAGWIGEAEKAELLRETDLLVVPSVWPEPFGLVGVEAGLEAVPAAAFDVGGIPDWLIPGVSGELAPADPPAAQGLAAAIVRALHDPEHYRRLSQQALDTARRFTLQGHLDQLETILTGVAHSAMEFSHTSRAAV
jgi:glycosyltransferase involved in cell wall biosynthesis